MANVWRAESNDPQIGGVVVEWPSGMHKIASWTSAAPIGDPLAAAKEYVTQLVQERIDSRYLDDVERTNVASLVAAVQKHIIDWNDVIRAKLYAHATPLQ